MAAEPRARSPWRTRAGETSSSNGTPRCAVRARWKRSAPNDERARTVRDAVQGSRPVHISSRPTGRCAVYCLRIPQRGAAYPCCAQVPAWVPGEAGIRSPWAAGPLARRQPLGACPMGVCMNVGHDARRRAVPRAFPSCPFGFASSGRQAEISEIFGNFRLYNRAHPDSTDVASSCPLVRVVKALRCSSPHGGHPCARLPGSAPAVALT